jgi:hypothetical protein
MIDNESMDHEMNGQDGDEHQPITTSRRTKRLAGAVGLLLVGGIAGGALAATSSASAAGTSSPAASSTVPAPGPRGRADTATAVRAGEKAETGANLATLKAAALKAVPGGSVYRVETDADGATYEAHMTKADGTHVTVKFGKNLTVTAIQDGMGAGGPGGPDGAMGRGGHSGPAGGTPPTLSGAGVSYASGRADPVGTVT